jgi:hypothetical protein
MPLGTQEFNFRSKLKFLFSPNMQNGLPLNAETLTAILKQQGFQDIYTPMAGETMLDAALIGPLNLFERAGESIYIECRKAL